MSYSSDLQIVVVKWFVLSKGCTWDVRCSAPTTSLYRSASANSVPVEELSEVQDITILCHNFCGVWVLKWIFYIENYKMLCLSLDKVVYVLFYFLCYAFRVIVSFPKPRIALFFLVYSLWLHLCCCPHSAPGTSLTWQISPK